MPNSPESEAQTRWRRIDPKLKGQGWLVTDSVTSDQGTKALAMVKYPTDNGPADYALSIGTDIVAVVETKRVTVGPQNVLTQAARYAQGIQEPQRQCAEGFMAVVLCSVDQVLRLLEKLERVET